MFKFLKKDKVNIEKIAKQQFEENRAVFDSLKAYDEGKKEISTTNIKRYLRSL